jgi:polyisoprenoid-binding protein YceI
MMTANVIQKWKIDPNHSEVQFKVKHLMISNVSGTFKIFHGDVDSDSEDFSNAEIHFEIDTNSIDTNLPERDSHLKSPLFLNAEKFPKILFNGILQKNEDGYELVGELTICATTRKVTLNVEFTGIGKGRFGDNRAGFELNGRINRKDFGLDWTLLTETGSLVVGEEIKLHCDMQLVAQANQ